MNGLNVFVIVLTLSEILAAVSSRNTRQIAWETEIEKSEDLFLKEWEAGNLQYLGKEIYAPDFVRITSGSVIEGDFEALYKFYKEHKNVSHITEGPKHIIAKCGNKALQWRTVKLAEGVTRNGTFVSLYEYKNGTTKLKLYQANV